MFAKSRKKTVDIRCSYWLFVRRIRFSLIVAIAKIAPDLKLNCFTIKTNVVDGKEGFTDDLPYARIVAKHLNLNLTEVSPEAEMIENFDSMIYQLDEPQADLAPYNVKIISKMASKLGIKVLIGGVGGDDLFQDIGGIKHYLKNI